jgi:hypothetical protein
MKLLIKCQTKPRTGENKKQYCRGGQSGSARFVGQSRSAAITFFLCHTEMALLPLERAFIKLQNDELSDLKCHLKVEEKCNCKLLEKLIYFLEKKLSSLRPA